MFYKRHISRSRKCFNVPLKTKISFLKRTQIFKESEGGKNEEDKVDWVIVLSCRLVFHYHTSWHMFANLYWWCINYHVIHIYSYSCTWYGSRNCSQRTTSLYIHMPQITKFKPTTHDEENAKWSIGFLVECFYIFSDNAEITDDIVSSYQ